MTDTVEDACSKAPVTTWEERAVHALFTNTTLSIAATQRALDRFTVHIEANRKPLWCVACGAMIKIYWPPTLDYVKEDLKRGRLKHECGGELSQYRHTNYLGDVG
jgi:Tfp pilus assembly protein PilV